MVVCAIGQDAIFMGLLEYQVCLPGFGRSNERLRTQLKLHSVHRLLSIAALADFLGHCCRLLLLLGRLCAGKMR